MMKKEVARFNPKFSQPVKLSPEQQNLLDIEKVVYGTVEPSEDPSFAIEVEAAVVAIGDRQQESLVVVPSALPGRGLPYVRTRTLGAGSKGETPMLAADNMRIIKLRGEAASDFEGADLEDVFIYTVNGADGLRLAIHARRMSYLLPRE